MGSLGNKFSIAMKLLSFGKKMPHHMRKEKTMPDCKPTKGYLTLLLCANASGDCKIKPLLIYPSENPRAFKKYNVQKEKLKVMWRSNSKAWITRNLLTEWYQQVFASTVRNYLKEKNFPMRALLLMDDAPVHIPGINEDLSGDCDFIEVKILSLSTAPLIQPIDQQVTANFKKTLRQGSFPTVFGCDFEL